MYFKFGSFKEGETTYDPGKPTIITRSTTIEKKVLGPKKLITDHFPILDFKYPRHMVQSNSQ